MSTRTFIIVAVVAILLLKWEAVLFALAKVFGPVVDDIKYGGRTTTNVRKSQDVAV